MVQPVTITLHSLLPADLSSSFPLFSYPCLLAALLPTTRHISFFLFPTVRRGRERKRKEEGTKEGTPHDRSAKLKARHKPFYTPTRSTLALAISILLPRPLRSPSPLLSPPSSFFLSLPTPSGLIAFLSPLLSSPPPPPSPPSSVFFARPWRRVDRKLHAIIIRLSAGLRLNRYTTSSYSPLEQVAGGCQPVFPHLYRSYVAVSPSLVPIRFLRWPEKVLIR